MLAPPISSSAKPALAWKFSLGSGNGSTLSDNQQQTGAFDTNRESFAQRANNGRRKNDGQTPKSTHKRRTSDSNFRKPDTLPGNLLLQTSILASHMPDFPAVSPQPLPITFSLNIRDKRV